MGASVVYSSFAEGLERELTAAQAEIARLKAGGCARDQRTTQFCAEAVKLQEENAKLQERISRLEAYGDSLDELLEAPDPNCSCHISPPCNDCVDYGAIRQAKRDWKEAKDTQ